MNLHHAHIFKLEQNVKGLNVFETPWVIYYYHQKQDNDDCHKTRRNFNSPKTTHNTTWEDKTKGFARRHPKQSDCCKELTTAASLLDAAWLEKLRRAIGMQSVLPAPTELEVGRIVIPLVFEAGLNPTHGDVASVLRFRCCGFGVA